MEIKISTSAEEPIDLSWLIKEARRGRIAYLLTHVSTAMKAVESVASSGSVKRALMGFDQLNRLSAKSGKSKAQTQEGEILNPFPQGANYWEALEKTIQLGQTVADKIVGINRATGEMATGMDTASISGNMVSRMLLGLGMAAQNMAADAVQVCLGVQDLEGNLTRVGTAAEESSSGLKRAWQPTGTWFHSNVYSPIRADVTGLWDGMEPAAKQTLDNVGVLFSNAGNKFSTTFTDAWKKVEGVFSGGGAVFEGLKSGVLTGFKTAVNKLIGGINDVVVEPFSGINETFAKLKSFSFGSVKPFKNLDFYIPLPKIPLLAQGAVLPANKPFMAVVGDQKHGTNIEAPLDTIRQAVAEVMAESVDAQLAGHSATVEVLKQILEAVLGISIDEGTITRAVERHRHRMAVMTGGY